MNSFRIKMMQTISRVGTAVRIKYLPHNKARKLMHFQNALKITNKDQNKDSVEDIKNQIMELVYPHVLHEQREHSKPVDPYEETEF